MTGINTEPPHNFDQSNTRLEFALPAGPRTQDAIQMAILGEKYRLDSMANAARDAG